ncbi:2-phosphosulfolactate phosphatase [Bacillus sp. HMF5848]|uniref:2-phosphosulfolactate phosphatase n=1 Tax=Bacillus sp. HMF5848 TaxID=2495421 RepID=UPI0021ADD980|nr:2-phosphosulfolactate phosphatase [Bacillus sp. HMF5848]
MGRIHVLLKKEDIDEVKIQDDKVAIVLDILLATSTITSALQHQAHSVIPVLNKEEAEQVAKNFVKEEIELVGEYEGKTLDGFLDPNPLSLQKQIVNKTMILSTTNGTVAIRKCEGAKEIFVCSLLNAKAIAKAVTSKFKEETIIIVCSGSSNNFCMEDFYGAGCLIKCLLEEFSQWELTDAAKASYKFYKGIQSGEDLLRETRVGQMLLQYGFDEELAYVAKENQFDVVPIVTNNSHIINNSLCLSGKEGD